MKPAFTGQSGERSRERVVGGDATEIRTFPQNRSTIDDSPEQG